MIPHTMGPWRPPPTAAQEIMPGPGNERTGPHGSADSYWSLEIDRAPKEIRKEQDDKC